MEANYHLVDTTEQQELYLLRSALAVITDLILITDERAANILFVNQAFELKTGFARREVLGKSCDFLYASKTQLDEINRIHRDCAQHMSVHSELIIYDVKGDACLMAFDVVPVKNNLGCYTHWVWTGRDVNLQKSLKSSLQSDLVEEQSMDSTRRLAGGLAHDFNNILGVIMGNADVFLENLDAQSSFRPLVDFILRVTNKGVHLTQTLLTFAQKQVLNNTELDLNHFILTLQPLLTVTLGPKHQMKLHFGHDLWLTSIDPKYLEIALCNLVLNSAEAMLIPGRLTLHTSNLLIEKKIQRSLFLAAPPGEYVKIEISDSGCGMTDEVKAKIFAPFYTTKAAKGSKGLGLSAVHGFIKQSGGYCFVSSELDKGSSFTLLFKKASPAAMSIVEI
ncbi:MAG: two-component system cell cycle sensor histidine kinase/response regulator CckA [Paraglaciecola sp.]|jgi:two-component system cell cycle sensor histidine kinase/response regulator CckA